MQEMDRISFLVGRWFGRYSDQFGQKGILESNSVCELVLGGRFLQWVGKTTKDGAPLNESLQFIGYDETKGKYVFKRLWSYGFIENGEGQWDDSDRITFDITSVENAPTWFEGTRWRSFIRRYGADEIGHGLFAAKEGEDYQLYGESKVTRVSQKA
jgi:hypothetical protein